MSDAKHFGSVCSPTLCGGLLFAILGASAASGQAFGRWWWEGRAAYGAIDTKNEASGEEISAYENQGLDLRLALNGYLGHPGIGRFRLGLDYLATNYDRPQSSKQKNFGFEGQIDLVPRGAYPTNLWFRRGSFDTKSENSTALPNQSAIADQLTLYGLRTRIKKGPLRGLRAQFSSSTLDFDSPGKTTSDEATRASLDWSRVTRRFQNSLALDGTRNSYERAGYSLDYLLAAFRQVGTVGAGWIWNLDVSGNQTVVRRNSVEDQQVDDFRYFHSFERQFREVDRLLVRLDAGWVSASGRSESLGYSTSLAYYRRLKGRLSLGPFAQLARSEADGANTQSARTGFDLVWFREGVVDFSTTLRAGWSLEDSSSEQEAERSDTFYYAHASVARGELSRLRTSAEVEIGRNEIRFSVRGPNVSGPEFPVALRVGDEDFFRTRLSLVRSNGSWSTALSAQAGERRFPGTGPADSFDVTDWLATLELGMGRLVVSVSGGGVASKSPRGDEASTRYGNLATSLTVFRGVTLRGSYRVDRRESFSLPPLDGERFDASMNLSIGRLSLEFSYFDISEDYGGGGGIRNSGMRWSVGRSFAGWLPIVTGGRRRGEVL